MSLSCRQTGTLLTKALAERATEAERLQLEQHLASCAACRRTQAALEPLRRLKAWQPPPLSGEARERVHRALLETAATALAAPPRSGYRAFFWFALGCVGAFIIAVISLGPRPATHRRGTPATAPATQPTVITRPAAPTTSPAAPPRAPTTQPASPTRPADPPTSPTSPTSSPHPPSRAAR
jgi:hypothetical protein